MDGFRERLSGRFERSPERGSLDRSSVDRYERSPRSGSGSLDGSGVKLVTEVIDKSNTKQLEIISDFFDEAKDERVAIGKELLQALDENAGLMNEFRIDVSDQMRSSGSAPAPVQVPSVDGAAKEEIMQAVLGNTALLNMVRQEIAAPKEVPAETALEESSFDMEAIGTYFKDMEEHVHKENVKCYRNVQAVITEESTQATGQTKKNMGSIKILSIISIVLSIVNIGLLTAYIFGVI